MSVSKIKTKTLDEKQRNDVSNIFTSEDMENVTRIPDLVSNEIYEWRILHCKTLITHIYVNTFHFSNE